MSRTGRSRPPRLQRPALATVLALLAAGCAPRTAPEAPDRLTIAAYSVVREAVHEGLIPAFAARWKALTGRDARFEESYSASGAQSRAIASGFDADVVLLSLEDDMVPLVQAGLVAPSWNDDGHRGMLTRSLVVLGVRPGNPRAIKDWPDLTRAGIAVLYPDPKSSGGARWNLNAIYGAGLLGDRSDAQAARTLLSRVQANVVNMDSSGRQSLGTFERGTGDVVVTYENELRLRLDRGGPGAGLESIIPSRTLLIEGPAAVVETSVARHGNRALAEAFLDFARGPDGQAILKAYGHRSLDEPLPPGTFTMADLGGWASVKAEVFGPGGLWTSIFAAAEGAR